MPSILNSKDVASFFTILQLIIQIQQLVLVESNPTVNCDRLNRYNSDTCVTTPDKCGHCLQGYIIDSENPQRCIALKLLRFPQNEVKGVVGQSIELPCEFNEEIQCVWERNGSNANVDNNTRYRFKDTRHCTLIIQPLRAIDLGPWQCSSKATSDTESIKSPLIHINLTPVVTSEPDLWIPMTFSDPVNLKCTFDQPVACDWKRKSKGKEEFESVTIDGINYEYLNETTRSNCSIRINGLREEDEGLWECEGKVRNTDFVAKSKKCVLTGTHKKKAGELHVYMRGDVVDGQVLGLGNNSELECISDDVIGDLRWEIDEQLIFQSESPSIKLSHATIVTRMNTRSSLLVSCHLISPFNRRSVFLKIINNNNNNNDLKKAGSNTTAAGLVTQLLFAVCMTTFLVVIIVVAILIRSDNVRCATHKQTKRKRQSTEAAEENQSLTRKLHEEENNASTSKEGNNVEDGNS